MWASSVIQIWCQKSGSAILVWSALFWCEAIYGKKLTAGTPCTCSQRRSLPFRFESLIVASLKILLTIRIAQFFRSPFFDSFAFALIGASSNFPILLYQMQSFKFKSHFHNILHANWSERIFRNMKILISFHRKILNHISFNFAYKVLNIRLSQVYKINTQHNKCSITFPLKHFGGHNRLYSTQTLQNFKHSTATFVRSGWPIVLAIRCAVQRTFKPRAFAHAVCPHCSTFKLIRSMQQQQQRLPTKKKTSKQNSRAL